MLFIKRPTLSFLFWLFHSDQFTNNKNKKLNHGKLYLTYFPGIRMLAMGITSDCGIAYSCKQLSGSSSENPWIRRVLAWTISKNQGLSMLETSSRAFGGASGWSSSLLSWLRLLRPPAPSTSARFMKLRSRSPWKSRFGFLRISSV